MSPRYDNLFESHMPEGDPRSLVQAAGGCTWPTVPAFRYLLVSDNATGIWSYLNTVGTLIEHLLFFPGHDSAAYGGGFGGGPLLYALAEKRYGPGNDFYEWIFRIQHTLCSSEMGFTVSRPYETCNRMIPLGDHGCPDEPGDRTGSTFRMLQVVFDETEPPGGWPPA